MKTLDPNSLALHAEPYPAYGQLREESPVHWSPEFQRYLLTRYEDVRAAYHDPQTFSSETLRLRTGRRRDSTPGRRLCWRTCPR